MNKLKTFLAGAGVMLYNIGASSAGLFQRCTGTCGSCGGQCTAPVIGLIAIGALIYFRRKLARGWTMCKSKAFRWIGKVRP